MIYRIAPFFLCFLLWGCDLFAGEEDPTIRASGTVVLAETGAPIGGLGVAVVAVPPSFGGSVAVATARTNADGTFALRYDVPQSSGASVQYTYVIRINDSPYDSRYTTSGVNSVNPPETLELGVIELSLND